MPDPKNIFTVVLADDHPLIINGISDVLKNDPTFKLIATASSGEEVLEIFKNSAPDILLSDVSMGEMNGIELSKEIKEKYPNTRILIITQHKEASIINALLDLDVNGIVSKVSNCSTYIDALNKIINGDFYFSEDIGKIVLRLAQTKRKEHQADFKLTRREKQVLFLLLEEKTSKEIAAEIKISFNTVETYRKNLITKFDVKSTVGLVKKALELGLIKG